MAGYSQDEWGNLYDETGKQVQRFAQAPAGSSENMWDRIKDVAHYPLNAIGNLNDAFSTGYDQGNPHVPNAVMAPVQAGQTLWGNSQLPDGRLGMPNPNHPENQDAYRTLLMTMFGGNALKGTGAGSLAARALSDTGKPSLLGSALASHLDMSPEARMQRARDMGFDTDQTLYHGTNSTFDEFKPSFPHPSNNVIPQVHLTTSKDEAAQHGDNILETMIRGKYAEIDNPMTLQDRVLARLRKTEGRIERSYDREALSNGKYESPYPYDTLEKVQQYLRGAETTNNYADTIAHERLRGELSRVKREGFDGARIAGGWGDDYAGDHYIVFDHRNIRSVNAAFDPAKSDSANLLASDNKPSLLGSALASAQEPVMAYRGVRYGDYPGTSHPSNPYWMTDDPRLASEYAMQENNPHQRPAVVPASPDFKNPLEVDAASRSWGNIPFEGADLNSNHIAEIAKERGHDGLVLRNVIDAPNNTSKWSTPSNVYAALQRGTVRSPLTGETLFSDTGKPSLLGSALAPDNKWYHGTMVPFDGGFRLPGGEENALAFSTSPELSSAYAGSRPASDRSGFMTMNEGPVVQHENYDGAQPRVYPVNLSPKNPKVINRDDWLGRGENAALIEQAKREGHDGLILNYTSPGYDKIGGLKEALMWHPDTVRSATTGETLFSDTGKPSIMGSALASSRKQVALDGGPGDFHPAQYGRLNMIAGRTLHEAALLKELAQRAKGNLLDDYEGNHSFNPKEAITDALDQYRGDRQYLSDAWDKDFDIAKAGGFTPFHYDIKDADGKTIGAAKGHVAGDTMHFDWLGGGRGDANTLGVSGVKALREQVRKDFPDVKNFAGERVSGARAANDAPDKMQMVKILSDTGKPSLLGSALAAEQNPFKRFLPDTIPPYDNDPEGLFFGKLSDEDRAHYQKEWMDKIRRTGELFSDQKPSLLGSALASAQEPEDIAGILRKYLSSHALPGNNQQR